MSDSGSDNENRQRIEERPELHHEDEIHQHHRDAERDEDAPEHLLLALDLAALDDAIARRQPDVVRRARMMSCVTSPSDAPLMFAPIVTTRCAVEVVDLRRPVPRVIGPPGRAGRSSARPHRPSPAPAEFASVGDVLARLGREPHADVREFRRRDRSMSPASTPANAGRSACAICADAHAELAGEAAVDLDVELRLLAARREPDIHRTGHAPDAIRDLLGELIEHGRYPGRVSCSWIVLLVAAEP